jgi:hypothetical protein
LATRPELILERLARAMTGLACWRPELISSFEFNSLSLAPSIVRSVQRRSSQPHNSVVQLLQLERAAARAALLLGTQGRRAGRQQETRAQRREGPGGGRAQPGALALGQARGASAHAKNASCARRDRGARVASRKQRARDARVQAQAHYESEEEEGKRHTARGTALATPSSVQRGLFRRRTFEEALGAAQRWTPTQLCFGSSEAGGIVASLRMH